MKAPMRKRMPAMVAVGVRVSSWERRRRRRGRRTDDRGNDTGDVGLGYVVDACNVVYEGHA